MSGNSVFMVFRVQVIIDPGEIYTCIIPGTWNSTIYQQIICQLIYYKTQRINLNSVRKSKIALILRHLHWINTCSFWLISSLRGKNTNSEPVYIRSRTPWLKLWWTAPLPSGCFRQITGYRSKCYENWGSFFDRNASQLN